MANYTASIGWLASLVKVLPQYNIEPYEFLESFGIRKSMFQIPDTQISLEKAIQLFDSLANREHTGALGLAMAKYTEPASLGTLGIACMCSPNLLEAFKSLEKFQGTVTNITSFAVKLDDNRCTLTIANSANHPGSFYCLDWALATMIRFSRLRLGKKINPLKVDVGRTVNQEVAGIYRKIARAPVSFDRDEYSVCYDRAHVEASLPSLQRHVLNDAFIELKREKKAREDEKSHFLSRFQNSLKVQLSIGPPSLKAIAADLHQSERSLQRHLRLEGKSFRMLLNELRRELAVEYLKKSHLAVSEISYLLGFSNPSSFSRWFRIAFGKSPQNFQK